MEKNKKENTNNLIELNKIEPSQIVSAQKQQTQENNSNKIVNLTLHIEHFENNRKEDVEELMHEMDFIARKELLGNGGA